jgi:CheY-like chemotaxis protein
MIAQQLQLLGSETEIAHDGVEAVQKATTYRPDAILLDIGLPAMNGFDVCRIIRKEPWGQGIVIVAMTGWGQEEDRHRSTEAGFNGHLVKPVDPSDLLRALSELSPGAA